MSGFIRPALSLLIGFTVLLGFVYPAAVTAFAQMLFPAQANGSLVAYDGRIAGSELIGQPFSDPGCFWGRPSSTLPSPYDAAASSGSNLGPSNPALRRAVEGRLAALREACPGNAAALVPVDLVTASGSGLDPHISPEAAYYQVPRVARARGLPDSLVMRLVEEHVEGRTMGLLGEPRVNVLLLNIALEEAVGESQGR
jgi:K+-transporting ATPase ATPase C chain